MTRVDPGTAPARLDGSDSPGGLEIATAIEFYDGKPANADKPFEFSEYRHPTVKEALLERFHGKCAYCESYFAHVAPLDVEHYRPKSGYVVDGRLKKPGYYWLAAAWTNLLPSCIDCNRPRVQSVAGEDAAVSGKANRFPLSSERSRAVRPGEERRERRLLFNPYLDDAADHFEFDADGNIRPKRLKRGVSRMGQTTIGDLGLQRAGLVEARRAHARAITATIRRIEELARELDESGSPRIERLMREELSLLKASVRRDHPYTEMATQLVDRFLQEMAA